MCDSESHAVLNYRYEFLKRPPQGATPRNRICDRSNLLRCANPSLTYVHLGNQDIAESEGSMGARRMPWRRKPTKGAASRDSPGGGANGLRSRGARMGEPAAGHAAAPAPESIGGEEATGGTETSKYPEEEKSTEIPGVAASETGRRPNRHVRHSLGALAWRGCGGRRPGA